MAASVLGKRNRSVVALAAAELSLPRPTRKRRTHNVTVRIYNDGDASTESQVLDASHPELSDHSSPISTRDAAKSHDALQRRTEPAPHAAAAIPLTVKIVPDENTPPDAFTTPTATRFRDALPGKLPITPRHRIRLTGAPSTPRTPRTGVSPVNKTHTIYFAARQLFSQSSNPGKIIGRDAERQELTDLISHAATSKSGGCTYISGPPGTGKSALTQEVFEEVRATPSLKTAFINCVSIKSSKELQTRLVQDLCPHLEGGKKAPVEILSSLFTAKKPASSTTYLVVLDEMDSLLDTDSDVLSFIFECALQSTSRLYLIGIANALDLTDRFLPQLRARNLKPHLLPFLPYTAKQISDIIIERLRSTLPLEATTPKDFVPFMQPAAIQLSSKKIASQSGDLRKAFSLVRRAIDHIEHETMEQNGPISPSKQPLVELSNLACRSPPTPPKSSPLRPSGAIIPSPRQEAPFTVETAPRVTIAHVARLSSSCLNNSTTSRLGCLNLQQKAVLCSLVSNEQKRARREPFVTPSKAAARMPTIKDLFLRYAQLCKRDEGLLHPLKPTEFRDVVASLETLGLIYGSAGRASSLTPTHTPSRPGRNPDDKQMVSGVSEKEMMASLKGPGTDILMRLLSEHY